MLIIALLGLLLFFGISIFGGWLISLDFHGEENRSRAYELGAELTAVIEVLVLCIASMIHEQNKKYKP